MELHAGMHKYTRRREHFPLMVHKIWLGYLRTLLLVKWMRRTNGWLLRSDNSPLLYFLLFSLMGIDGHCWFILKTIHQQKLEMHIHSGLTISIPSGRLIDAVTRLLYEFNCGANFWNLNHWRMTVSTCSIINEMFIEASYSYECSLMRSQIM